MLSKIKLEHGSIITNHLRVFFFFLQNGKKTMYEAFWLDTDNINIFSDLRGAASSLLHGFRWVKVKTKHRLPI